MDSDLEKRICDECNKEKTIKSFNSSRGYRRRTCRACDNTRLRKNNPDPYRKSQSGKRQRNPASAILNDCRSSDKKKNRDGNDLDLDFVSSIIQKGCSYCGSSSMRISLDRIDNNKAHTIDNVVPACFRCNMIRGSMPYEAWISIVPSIKRAYKLGLFGEWRCTPFNIKNR